LRGLSKHKKSIYITFNPVSDSHWIKKRFFDEVPEFEKDKIKGAIRTDFILSAEIIVITLGTAAAASFGQQLAVLVAMSLIMTVGVYGLVGAIVKIDDAGLYLIKQANTALKAVGHGLLAFAPWLMKTL
jgi:predicted DNA repair protein MutK